VLLELLTKVMQVAMALFMLITTQRVLAVAVDQMQLAQTVTHLMAQAVLVVLV
jgi:hypothetical protein